MSPAGHKERCNKDALIERAERAVSRSRSLRMATNSRRLMIAERRASIVLPHFGPKAASTRQLASQIVAVAFSAGGLEPLIHLLHALPADFPAAIAVAHHVGAVSCLPALLSNQTRLAVKFAESGEPLLDSTVYVCPPLCHLIVNPDATIVLSTNPRLAYARPSADWFFTSVAGSFDGRASAVVLSGASSDGAKGIARISRAGGKIIVQDPRTCLFPTMPQAALDAVRPSGVHAPAELGPALIAGLHQRDLTTAQAEWEHPFGPIAA